MHKWHIVLRAYVFRDITTRKMSFAMRSSNRRRQSNRYFGPTLNYLFITVWSTPFRGLRVASEIPVQLFTYLRWIKCAVLRRSTSTGYSFDRVARSPEISATCPETRKSNSSNVDTFAKLDSGQSHEWDRLWKNRASWIRLLFWSGKFLLISVTVVPT